MAGLSRLLLPWSKIAWKASSPSFFVFHESLLASARTVVPFRRPSTSTRGNKSSKGSPPAPAPLDVEDDAATLARSACVLLGSGAGLPSTLSNSPVIVLSSCAFKSSKKSLMPDSWRRSKYVQILMINALDPAYNLTVTSVLVALVRTAALEFCSAVLRNSMRLRRDSPAIPNSNKAVLIQVSASARTFGAFCLDSGSYAESK